MKTNQVLTRKMGEFDVYQRTSDGYFNANALLRQWNSVEGNSERSMKRFLDSPKTNEFIEALIRDESQRAKTQSPNIKVVNSVKSRTFKDGSKTVGQVWMHPLLFIKFAMWINPTFEVTVLRFVYDELIRYRNDAGDAYKEMSAQIQIISPAGVPFRDIIRGVSRAVNIVIYGRHESMIRNKVGDERKIRELFEIERDVAKMIKRGFIKTMVELRQFLLAEYRERHEPKLMEI